MAESNKQVNQRRCERYVTPGLIDFVFSDESDYHYGFLVNLCKQGLYVESSRMFDVGTVQTLRFVLPVLDWVFEVKARVQWAQVRSQEERMLGYDDGMGYVFDQIDEKDAQQLDIFFGMHQRGETEITDFTSTQRE